MYVRRSNETGRAEIWAETFRIHKSLCYIYYKYATVVGMRKIVVISRSLVTNLVIGSIMFFYLPSSNTCHTTRLKNHTGEHDISGTN